MHWFRFVAPTGTNVLHLPKPRCVGMFSPTLLAEERSHLFISAASPSPSNSSELQACGPNLTPLCLWACWAFCGPESWPMDGFLVVFRPWWPSRWHFFLFCYLVFHFYLELNTYSIFSDFFFLLGHKNYKLSVSAISFKI